MQKNKILIMSAVFLFSVFGHIFNTDSTNELENDTFRAVSLTRMQQNFKNSREDGRYSQELEQLGGLKEITGIMFDDSYKDMILIGITDASLPVIYTEDFVVALRNAWMKYADLRGNTYYYSSPGCSIDPDQQIIQKLNIIGNKVLSSTTVEQTKKELQEWHSICRKPQEIRIMGIPFNSHFAEVIVKADYDMKNIVNGTDSVGIPGLYSLMDMKENQVLEKIQNNEPVSVSLSMNRFWFYPGENMYEESEGVLLIKQCPVHLLTENEYHSSGNKVDPLAKKFAHDLTDHYEQLAERRSIYRELHNLFCLVSIAGILEYKNTGSIEQRLNYLLNEFSLPQTQVNRSLPGQSAIREFEHREELANGYSVLHMWLPSCGGVDINIQIDKNSFQSPADNSIFHKLRNKILNQKDAENFYWDVKINEKE
ncbi:MAG: DUF1598 domain-containing protein [bacterium]